LETAAFVESAGELMDLYTSSTSLLSDHAQDDDDEIAAGTAWPTERGETGEMDEEQLISRNSEILSKIDPLSIHIEEETLDGEQERAGEGADGGEGSPTVWIDKPRPARQPIVDENKVEETPLPMGKMIPIMLLTASESFNSSAIFSYVGYLVLDFNLTDDKKELGYVASLWCTLIINNYARKLGYNYLIIIQFANKKTQT
jgi:hypothetical protein